MDNSKKGVISRIQELRKSKGLTIQGLSDATQFPKGTLEKYLNGPKYPNVEFIIAFCSTFGVSTQWLLEGTEANVAQKSSTNGVPHGQEKPDLTEQHLNGRSFVQVPRYDIQASAGHGSAVASEFAESHYGFKREWLKRRGLNANRLSVISVAGDSMEPSLYDNDLVLIDHASTDLTDSNIYAVRFSGELYVKRIQRLPNNLVLLISANSAYPPIEITHPVADGVEVIGRVVASMHEW